MGSRNPAKTTGIRNAFASFFPSAAGAGASQERFRFVEVDATVVTRNKSQPLGFAETMSGAKARARHAIGSARADLGVGVEAGILSPRQGQLNLQLAVIVDGRGKFSVGSSAGFMLPDRFVGRIRSESKELDSYAHELTGAPRVEEVDGVIYHLSQTRISRVQMTEQCVSMALVPWLNPGLYGLSSSEER
jgi:inosine/xanthosine triphosphatase